MEKFSALQIVDDAIIRLEAPSLIFDAPTKREGRKVSRKQWMRQNAKRRRGTLKARAWMMEASRLIDARLRRELETLYGGHAGGSFRDSVLTMDELNELIGIEPEVKPTIKWYSSTIPMTSRSPFWNVDSTA